MPGGAPEGNKNAERGHMARRALEAVLAEQSGYQVASIERFEALKDVWRKQFEKATQGDNDSAKMIVDRLDGRPTQAVVADVDTSLTIEVVKDFED